MVSEEFIQIYYMKKESFPVLFDAVFLTEFLARVSGLIGQKSGTIFSWFAHAFPNRVFIKYVDIN